MNHLDKARNWLQARFSERSQEHNIVNVYTADGPCDSTEDERVRALVTQEEFHDFLMSIDAPVVATTAECERLGWISTTEQYQVIGGGNTVPVGPRCYLISRQVNRTPPSGIDLANFDTFLSHSSKDKPHIRVLADALIARGLKPWLDERELVPGRPWQDALEDIIATTKTAVVAVGESGLGPWEEPEMRACLSEFVDRKLPIIPVLLPDASSQPELPIFLKAFTWVDLRHGLTDGGLDRLQWGITGQKPASLGSATPPVTQQPPTQRIDPKQSASGPVAMWKEKLEYFQQQEAIAADPAQKFALKKQIEEAEAKIRELGG